MKDIERAAVRFFLDLDLSRGVDISIQDRFSRGFVEAPRANVYHPALILDKDVSDISEVKTQRSNIPRATAYNRETNSDSGGGIRRKSLWETSSLSSQTMNEVVGKGSLFHGQVRGELTVEKLRTLQTEYQKQTPLRTIEEQDINIYEISNMKQNST